VFIISVAIGSSSREEEALNKEMLDINNQDCKKKKKEWSVP